MHRSTQFGMAGAYYPVYDFFVILYILLHQIRYMHIASMQQNVSNSSTGELPAVP